MSEHTSDTNREFNQLLESTGLEKLEAAVRDPYYSSIVRLAKEMNMILSNELDISSEDAWEIARGLDEEWGIRGSVVRATGRIKLQMISGETEEVPVDNIEVMTDGFMVEKNTLYRNGEYIGERYELKHHLAVAQTTPNGAVSYRWVTAGLDEVELRPKVHSLEHIEAWLDVYCPKVKSELDARLSRIETSEVELFSVLRGMSVPVDAKEDNSELASYASEYVNRKVPLDSEVPYDLVLEGPILMAHKGRTKLDETDGELPVIAKIPDVQLAQVALLDDEGGETSVLQFYAPLIIYGPHTSGDPVFMQVPLETIQYVASIRHQFYQDQSKKSDTGAES